MKSKDGRPSLTLVLGFVFLAHLALILTLPSPPLPKRERLPPLRVLLTRAAAESVPLTPAAVKSERSPAPPSQATRPESGRASKNMEHAGSSYGQILPRAGSLNLDLAHSRAPDAVIAQHSFAASRRGDERAHLLRDAGTLATLFDVPIRARRQTIEREANVRIVYESTTDTMELIDLRGEPLLRAVLYEALKDSATRAILIRVFTDLGLPHVRISLRTGGDSENFTWDGSRLTIVKADAPRSSSAGLALPDAEAQRAALRDDAALARLQISQAYRSQISKIKLSQ